MDSILKDSEAIASSAYRSLVLVVDVGNGPEGILASLTLSINEARSKLDTHRNVIEVLDWHIVELAMSINYFTYDL